MSHPVAYISISEASKYFGVSKRTVQRYISDGTISETQITYDSATRKISVAELERVF